jgi:hypothetical protein
VLDTSKAISEGRSKAQLLHAVAMDKPASELKALGANSVTDCFTNPCGWLQPTAAAAASRTSVEPAAAGVAQAHCIDNSVQWQDLQLLRELLQPGAVPGLTGSFCLVLAGLSTLLLRHSDVQVRAGGHLTLSSKPTHMYCSQTSVRSKAVHHGCRKDLSSVQRSSHAIRPRRGGGEGGRGDASHGG